MNINSPAKYVINYQKYVFLEYRQKLLDVFLQICIWITFFLLIINLIERHVDPENPWHLQNIIADLVTLAILSFFLWANSRGWVNFSAWGILFLVLSVIYQSYSPSNLTSSLVLVTLPIALSSFLIHPLASFLFMALTLAFYFVVYLTYTGDIFFDQFASLVLPVLAGGSYYISSLLNQTISELVVAYDETIQGWATALEMRDSETQGHSARVCELTMLLARKMKFPERDMIHLRRGVLLHDIGKMAIPDSILHKPGPLTEAEWQIMRKHPEYARTYLAKVPFLGPALDVPYFHHERWDGSGYPCGLIGTKIPLAARIFAVLDVWDALTSDRPYRNAWSEAEAKSYLIKNRGVLFDPDVVDSFFELIG